MSACEKCWEDSAVARQAGDTDAYSRLLRSRVCTPEEQAGSYATKCPACDRWTCHQHTQECMACRISAVGEPVGKVEGQ